MADKNFSKMKPIYEQKCSNCMAPLVFNPSSGKLECAWCGSVFEVKNQHEHSFERGEQDHEATSEFHDPRWTPTVRIERTARDHALNTMKPLPVYNCLSCGAEVLALPESAALTCPYCKNHIVLTKQVSGVFKPDTIIPFKVPNNKIKASAKAFIQQHKKDLPKDFLTRSTLGNITGIYVPFWLFDCDVAGNVTLEATAFPRTHFQGDHKIIETDHYRLERSVAMSFATLPIDASLKLDNDLMDSLQPYDFSQLVPFDIQYLAGFVADRFDESSESSFHRAEKRAANTAARVTIERGASRFSGAHVTSNMLGVTIRNDNYALLPVYLINVDYKGTKYKLAINGQTGKMVGDFPFRNYGDFHWFLPFFILGFLLTAFILWYFFCR